MVEEGRRRAQGRRQRVRAWGVPTLPERIEESRVRGEVGAFVAVGLRQLIPTRAREALRERRRGLERELPCREDDELVERRL